VKDIELLMRGLGRDILKVTASYNKYFLMFLQDI